MNEDLLNLWAQKNDLSESRAETIRAAILEDVTLDHAWWQALFTPMRRGLEALPRTYLKPANR